MQAGPLDRMRDVSAVTVFIIPSCALHSAPARARLLLSRNAFRSSTALLTFRVGSEAAVVVPWASIAVICVTSVLCLHRSDDVLTHGGAFVCLVCLRREFLLLLLPDRACLSPDVQGTSALSALSFLVTPSSPALY